ncbi:MAG: redox-sensing transcriptional repressor Rex [Clostridia bacterium]|nr:redox-sensing transcriptional repressor Rex [Clostridia bacterium]
MSKSSKYVPQIVVRRLPRYYRHISELRDMGVERISSKELAEKMGLTASQIRQDFNCFGGFGQQGYGYNIEQLHKTIHSILGLDRGYKTVIIGAGNLGHAIANYPGFQRRGFNLVGIFDNSADVCGTVINGLTVKHIDTIEEEFEALKPDIVILTVKKQSAHDIVERICPLGIKGIWNFSHMELKVPDGIKIENVHLSESLMTLSHAISEIE